MICLTFDVEERFHSHLSATDAHRAWEAGDRLTRIIDLLVERGQRATFFIVGELAEHYPQLVRRIAECGFEVGSHTHTHLRLDRSDRAAYQRDIARSKAVLEDLTGTPILGFRAPSWSARLSDDWLWEDLRALGFVYDSSLFPFPNHLYGSLNNPVRPFRLSSGLIEIPPSVSTLGPLRIPYGGGFYFRLYPQWLTLRLIERDQRCGRTPIVYFHPWEFDPQATSMENSRLNRFIANHNTRGTWDAFVDLLARHRTTTMAEVLRAL